VIEYNKIKIFDEPVEVQLIELFFFCKII